MKCKLSDAAEKSCKSLIDEYIKYGLPWEKLVIRIHNILPHDPEESFVISVSRIHNTVEKIND